MSDLLDCYCGGKAEHRIAPGGRVFVICTVCGRFTEPCITKDRCAAEWNAIQRLILDSRRHVVITRAEAPIKVDKCRCGASPEIRQRDGDGDGPWYQIRCHLCGNESHWRLSIEKAKLAWKKLVQTEPESQENVRMYNVRALVIYDIMASSEIEAATAAEAALSGAGGEIREILACRNPVTVRGIRK